MKTPADVRSAVMPVALAFACAVQAQEKPAVAADPAGAPPPDKGPGVLLRPSWYGVLSGDGVE